MPRPTTNQRATPLTASLTIDPARLAAMWQMTPQQRRTAARHGELSFAEMCRWALRRPDEVDLVDGAFFFIAALQPQHAETGHAPG